MNARGIKHTFCGDLDAKIFTNPFFFETEKTYLRSQIARITLSSTLYPKGLLRFKEDSTREVEENTPEEGALEPPATEAMTKMNMWLHLYPSILKQGRLNHKEGKAEEGEEVEPEELQRREIEKDPWEPRLKPIVDDAKVQGGLPAWVLRCSDVEGNVTVDTKFGKKSKNFGTVIVKSLHWPGAYNFYHADKSQFIYVGDGLKHEAVKYYPTALPVMMTDRAEKATCEEPNPTEAWLAKKAEMDAKAAAGGAE